MKSTLKTIGIVATLGSFIALATNNLHLRRVIDELKTAENATTGENSSVDLSVFRISTPTEPDSQFDSPVRIGAHEADRFLSALESKADVRISRFPQTKVGSGLEASFELAEDRLAVVPTISPEGYSIRLAITTGTEGHDETHSTEEDLWTGETLAFRSSGDPSTLLLVKASITQ